MSNKKIMGTKKIKKNRINNVILIGALALLFLPVAILASEHMQSMQQHAASSVSPLIFGTNLTLNDAGDQFINSQATRDALASIHVQLIRMPIRGVGAPATWEVQAMQDIHAMGVTPIIILKYSQPDPLGAAQQVLTQAVSIFGNQRIYLEFGNERDLAGVSQVAYTTAWNNVIPTLKAQYPTAQFMGPVNFQQNPTYIAYFVHNAVPKPDAISWHEYTCGNSSDASYCLAHISNWGIHIANTKAAIQANGDNVPPIFITEWNYDPNNPSPDPRATAQFQQQFTQAALQELAKDGVTGATQYVATGHTEYNLVNPSSSLTAEGQEFGLMYMQLVSSQGGQPTTASPTPPFATATPFVIPSNTPTGIITIQPSLIPHSGNICSSQAMKACGYTSNCSNVESGTQCELQVNNCGKSSSGANIYTCTNGTWKYSKWVKTGACNFCGTSTKNHK